MPEYLTGAGHHASAAATAFITAASQPGHGHHLKAIGIILIVAVIVVTIAVVKAARHRRSGTGRAPSQ